jgi:type VI secretion system protein ImpM
MTDASAIPGWYGKLPTLGDFASRRLEGDFIEPWDLWLGEGLAAQREVLGAEWLDAYLRSPVWRFVLMPGALPGLQQPGALAGVLMPSVDRVGRYFPLTLVTRLTSLPRSTAQVEALLGWLHRLEDVAVDALHDDWSIDDLEGVLEALPPAVVEAGDWPEHLGAPRAALADALAGDITVVDVTGVRNRAELATLFSSVLGATATPVAPTVADGMAFWLADNPSEPRLLVSRGLPGRDDFVSMLGASGREPGADTIF